ncbi:MAG: hypothetical protein J4F42_06865 [Desulfurellaceae bacterium]|nr:hypothetical protein [Desulfurellaceae bacterium]
MPRTIPLRNYTASATDPEDLDDLGRWQEAFDYRIWSARLPLAGPQFRLFEMLPEGILEIPQQGKRLMHLIKAGVPHHVASLLGYWAVSDTDRIWIRAEWQDSAYYTIIMGGTPSAYRRDRLRWYCPGCGAGDGPARLARAVGRGGASRGALQYRCRPADLSGVRQSAPLCLQFFCRTGYA